MFKEEYELLIIQRNQLVEALSKTNASFQKTVLALFAGLVSIIVADSTAWEPKNSVVLFAIQILVLLILFIEALLIAGNAERYYISAIDEYLEKEYGITVLFYQGSLSRKHTIEGKSIFNVITIGATLFVVIFVFWMINEFELLTYLEGDTLGNKLYIFLLIAEVFAILLVMVYNIYDKKDPKVYRDCLEHLKRKKVGNRLRWTLKWWRQEKN